ncbi:MAG: hypothetical protein ACJ735_05820 [Actinomycetes bacterium]
MTEDPTPPAGPEPVDSPAGAPQLEDGLVRPTLDRVADAATALRDLHLHRDQTSTLIRWLIRKRCGLSATAPASWDGDDCQTFAEDMLAVPGPGEKKYYNPFNGSTMGSARSDWAIQTLYTQLSRQMAQPEKALYQPAAEQGTTGGGDTEGRLRFQQSVISPDAYLAGLQGLLGEKRVPLRDLAIWRYRYESFPPDITEEQLIGQFLGEFNVTEEEREALFTIDAAALGTPANGTAESGGVGQ